MQQAGMSSYPGEVILAIAVLSILYTAPLGAIAIHYSAPRLLTKEKKKKEQSTLFLSKEGALLDQ
jgi:NhaP-type Na+/H+ or K+/H+ antiporter